MITMSPRQGIAMSGGGVLTVSLGSSSRTDRAAQPWSCGRPARKEQKSRLDSASWFLLSERGSDAWLAVRDWSRDSRSVGRKSRLSTPVAGCNPRPPDRSTVLDLPKVQQVSALEKAPASQGLPATEGEAEQPREEARPRGEDDPQHHGATVSSPVAEDRGRRRRLLGGKQMRAGS